MRVYSWVGLVLFCGFVHSAKAADNFSLPAYLEEVKKSSPAFRSAVLSEQAAEAKILETSLLTKPNLFSTVQVYDDAQQTIQPQFSGTHTNAKSANLGVSQQFSFGLQSKLYYEIVHTKLQGATFAPYTDYYTHSPVLEVSQPLWRGAFGRSIHAQQAAGEAQQKSANALERFKQKQVLAQAEIAYWNLAFAKKSTRLRSETFSRSKLIVDWTSRRANLNLGDRVDHLQALAAYQSRELDLKTAMSDERNAEIAFFTLINKPVAPVGELAGWESNSILAIAAPSNFSVRDDVVAAQYLEEALRAIAISNSENIKPDVQVYGSIALNGLDSSSSQSFRKASGMGYRTLTGGVKLTVPLSFGTVSDLHSAYVKDKRAAELNTERAVRDSEQAWKELNVQFLSAKERLKLALELEKTQKDKLAREQVRLRQGRTTTYQGLVFEQDYSLAIGQRLQIEFLLLSINSQLKLFSQGSSL